MRLSVEGVDVLEPGQTAVTDQQEWRQFCLDAVKDLSLVRDGTVLDEVLGGVTFATERYKLIADRLEYLFGPWKGWKIVEVGAGYGGQARELMTRHSCSYSTVDLPEAMELQYAYLASHGLWLTRISRADLFISNYALSECRRETAARYLKIAERSPRGYITWNGWSVRDTPSKLEFRAAIPGSRWLPEDPPADERNECLVWGTL